MLETRGTLLREDAGRLFPDAPDYLGVYERFLKHAEGPERMLAALFTTAGTESVCEVRVACDIVFRQTINGAQ